jgi:YHS domain-containing protein
MNLRRLLTIVLVLPLMLAGCATGHDHSSGVPQATCHVCRYHNDLACVSIDLTAKTPHMDHLGTTYYFCSESCMTAFAKNPVKYMPK